jgi:hypothetical protein
MVLRGDLSESTYLIELYAQASENWSRFRDSQEQGDLLETAGILCEGMTRLREDHVFWGNLYDLPMELEQHRDSVQHALSNIEHLLAIEEEILTALLDDRAVATRLVTDVSLSIGIVHDLPSGTTIENLRSRVNSLQEAICDAWKDQLPPPDDPLPPPGESSPSRQGRARFFRAVRIVGKGLLVVGGGTLVVANGVAFFNGVLDPQNTLASATAGVGTILGQFER